MSDFDFLRSTELLDCNGRVSHRLTPSIDGTVDIRFAAGHVARVDPRTRVCLTPGVRIPQGMWTDIAALAR